MISVIDMLAAGGYAQPNAFKLEETTWQDRIAAGN